MIRQQDKMRMDEKEAYFRYVYQTATDEKLKNNLKKILTTQRNEPIEKKWEEIILYDTVVAALKRSCREKLKDNEINSLKDLINNHWQGVTEAFPGLTNRLIEAYFFKELRIDDADLYAKYKNEIRNKSQILEKPLTEDNLEYLYELTHVVYADSGFFEKYPDSKQYKKELGVFDAVLKLYSDGKALNGSETDLFSEILTARKLLKQKDNRVSIIMSNKIMAGQNSDGSFGGDKVKLENGRTHLTEVAVEALSDFPETFPEGKTYCPLTAAKTGT